MDLMQDLEFRGLVYQTTQDLAERLKSGPLTLYNGFDPTADSLTVGNLVPVLLLRRFQLAGHRAIVLVGGGTGLIGDPSGKSEERQLNAAAVVAAWTEKIRGELARFLDFDGPNPAVVVNNYDWLGQIKALDFLREVGKHFPLTYMLAKESVEARLQSGISYTEFSYMVLQAYDFLKLNEMYHCELQTGGSDQWGNITAGVDLVRRVAGRKAHGLTCPLVVKADGAKFGKSEGGAVWLDAAKTTPYQFYQFWINAEDQQVIAYLKVFTFLGKDEILQLEEEVRTRPERREAQRKLAQEVTTLVHGREAARKAEKISQALFYGRFQDLDKEEIRQGFYDVPTYTMKAKELNLMESNKLNLVDLLSLSGTSSSITQARRDIQNGAIYINGERCADPNRTISRSDGLHDEYLIVRRGKKNYHLVTWEPTQTRDPHRSTEPQTAKPPDILEDLQGH
jgi:tyrosyl-tRNA synthetase